MSDFQETGALQAEARRLLRCRFPLVLAVAINFVLLARVPFARVPAETPTLPASSLASAAPAAAAPDPCAPTMAAVSRQIDPLIDDAPQTPPTAASTAAASADSLAAAPAPAPAWRHDLAGQLASIVKPWAERWPSWRSPPGQSADVPISDVRGAKEESVVVVPSATPAQADATATDEPIAAQETPQPAATPAPQGLKLRNPVENGGSVSCLINGRVCELLPGDAHEFATGESWTVQFHRGESFGNAQRVLSPGIYRFMVTDQGWDLEAVAP